MKSEEWFIEQAKKINLIDPSGSEFEFIQRIYTEGRRDQNLADIEIASYTYNNPPPMNDKFLIDEILNAIRAAGPKEGE
jgi:hypothetical protein